MATVSLLLSCKNPEQRVRYRTPRYAVTNRRRRAALASLRPRFRPLIWMFWVVGGKSRSRRPEPRPGEPAHLAAPLPDPVAPRGADLGRIPAGDQRAAGR